jgi:hypothetical protein
LKDVEHLFGKFGITHGIGEVPSELSSPSRGIEELRGDLRDKWRGREICRLSRCNQSLYTNILSAWSTQQAFHLAGNRNLLLARQLFIRGVGGIGILLDIRIKGTYGERM